MAAELSPGKAHTAVGAGRQTIEPSPPSVDAWHLGLPGLVCSFLMNDEHNFFFKLYIA